MVESRAAWHRYNVDLDIMDLFIGSIFIFVVLLPLIISICILALKRVRREKKGHFLQAQCLAWLGIVTWLSTWIFGIARLIIVAEQHTLNMMGFLFLLLTFVFSGSALICFRLLRRKQITESELAESGVRANAE